ncbi:MAG: NAD-dependent deacetylase [Sulfurospirillum sp.]|nr:NAD-dependent deacetylase [Sulfurospirillum sp.]
MWNDIKIEDVCTKGCLERNRTQTIEFYNQRRIELGSKEPNYAHKVISQLKNKYPQNIAIITQNVDDMFEKAGCEEIIHLHGFIRNIRCMRDSCAYKEDIGYAPQDNTKRCPVCNKTLRPDVVFFYERAPQYKHLHAELMNCEMIVVIGTSGLVIDTDMLKLSKIKYSILNNTEPSSYIDDKLFSKVIYAPATNAIDEIAKDIELFLAKRHKLV